MDYKPVSVVIPCYNKRIALRKTLESTLSQLRLYKGDEVIVADGKSTDGVETMLDRDFMPEVQFVQVNERTPFNLNAVRNLGIRSATNDIIIIFDADCIPQQDCIDTLRKNADKGVFLSGLVAYEVPYKKQLKQAKKFGGMATSMIMMQNYPIEDILKHIEEDSGEVHGTIGSGMCFHKQDAYDVGLFDEEFDGYWGYQETEFIIKLYFNGIKLVNLTKRTSGMAISLHQPHKIRKRWRDKGLRRNRTLLRSKIPQYRQRIFPEVAKNDG